FPIIMNVITEGKTMTDKIEKIGNSTVQYGNSNDRVFLLKYDPADNKKILPELDRLAKEGGYSKIVTKIHTDNLPDFILNGYKVEDFIPKYYNGKTDCVMASKYFDKKRGKSPKKLLKTFSGLIDSVNGDSKVMGLNGFSIRKLDEADAVPVTEVLKSVFETYPFPVHKPEYILKTMRSRSAIYFGIWDNDKLIGVSTAETDFDNKNAEMTDFAVLPEYRGQNLASHLLGFMEKEMKTEGIKTVYT